MLEPSFALVLVVLRPSFSNKVVLNKVILDIPLIALCIADEEVLALSKMTQKGEEGNCEYKLK